MAQHAREGTPQELASFLTKRSSGRFRLTELPDETNETAKEPEALPDPGNVDSIALLQSWLEEDATADPEELRAAEKELLEFKRNMNKPRKAAGARLLFPEAECP